MDTIFLSTGPFYRRYAAIEHTHKKENITITPKFHKSDTKTFHEKI